MAINPAVPYVLCYGTGSIRSLGSYCKNLTRKLSPYVGTVVGDMRRSSCHVAWQHSHVEQSSLRRTYYRVVCIHPAENTVKCTGRKRGVLSYIYLSSEPSDLFSDLFTYTFLVHFPSDLTADLFLAIPTYTFLVRFPKISFA